MADLMPELTFKQLPQSLSVSILGTKNDADGNGSSGGGGGAPSSAGGGGGPPGSAGGGNGATSRKPSSVNNVGSSTKPPPSSMTPPTSSVGPLLLHQSTIDLLSPIFDKKICGFIFNFSNMMPGMLYRSRLDAGMNTDVTGRQAEERLMDKAGEAATDGEANQEKATDSDSEGSGDESDEDIEDLDLKQRMALTLRNWCSDERNLPFVAKEGALHALCLLASREDRITRRCCASAFDFLSQSAKIRQELVRVSAPSVIAQMAVSTKSIRVATSCASALCNLTLVSGAESRMAEEGAVVAICALLTFSNREIWTLSVQALYNLTCIADNYNGIDRILKGLLSSYETPFQELDPSQIVAQALCNLSVVYRMRLRILDEGSIDVINTAVMPFADNDMKYHVAVTLHNISCARTCRPEMVTKGALAPMLILSTQADTRILECIAATVQRLSLDPSSRRKTINDGALRIILNILARTPKATATRCCAEALHAFSSFDDCAPMLIKGGAIQALIMLSKMNDLRTHQSCAATFCNLFSIESSHAPILDEGCLPCILSLARGATDGILIDRISCLFNNMACGPRKTQVTQQGLVPCIVYVSDTCNSTQVKSRCSAALANLAYNQANIPQMVADGVVGCLARLLSTKDPGLLQHACIALALTAQDEAVKEDIVNQGVVEQLMKAIEVMSDEKTKQAYCAVLGSLSFCARSLGRLVQAGVIEAIFKLARTDDVATRKRCATALCNISFEPSVRRKMVEMNVVGTLSHLSNTYSDETQMDCASCFCNLSCNPENQEIMVKQGALTALLMIALVRAVTTRTKEVCARALLNLLNDTTIFKALDEGIVEALAALSGLDSEDCLAICAQAFRVISYHPKGRTKIVGKRTVMQGLFSLVRSGRVETCKLAGMAVHNLLLAPETQVAATVAGALAVVKVVATLRDTKSSIQCAQAITKISYLNPCRDYILKESIPSALVLLAQEKNVPIVIAALQALTCLSSIKLIRGALFDAGVVHVVTYHIFTATYLDHILEECARILNYFSWSRDLRPALTAAHVVCAAVVLCRRCRGHSDREVMLAITLENFSWITPSQERIIEDGGIHLLLDLVREHHDPRNVTDVKVARSACATFSNLARLSNYRPHLINAGVMEAITLILEKHVLEKERDAFWRVVLGLQNMSESSELHEQMAAKGAIRALIIVASHGNEVARQYCAGALCNFTKTQGIRPLLVEQGVIEALIKLSVTENTVTQRSCSVALANLSAHAKLKEGSVASLVRLFKSEDGSSNVNNANNALGSSNHSAKDGSKTKIKDEISAARDSPPGSAAAPLPAAPTGAGSSVSNGKKNERRRSSVAKLRRSLIAASFTHELLRLKHGNAFVKYDPKGMPPRLTEQDRGDSVDETDEDAKAFHRHTSKDLTVENMSLLDLVGDDMKTGSLAAMDVTPPPPNTCYYKCKRSGGEEEEGIAVMAAHEDIIRIPHPKLIRPPQLRPRFEEEDESKLGDSAAMDATDGFDGNFDSSQAAPDSPRAFAGGSSSSSSHQDNLSTSPTSVGTYRTPRQTGGGGGNNASSTQRHARGASMTSAGWTAGIAAGEYTDVSGMQTGRSIKKGISFASDGGGQQTDRVKPSKGATALERMERNLRRHNNNLPKVPMARYSYQHLEAKRQQQAKKQKPATSDVDMQLLQQAFHYGQSRATRFKLALNGGEEGEEET